MNRIGMIGCAALSLVMVAAVNAETNWPDYRGPGVDGHASGKGIPLQFGDTKNVAWKTPIHGRGWASPVVWGNQIWLTTATSDGKKMSAICVDSASGKVLFDKVIFENETVRPLSNNVNTYSSPSPVIEEGRVYVHWGSYGTAAIDTKSMKVLWTQRDLPCHHWRGPGSSPVIYKDLLVLTFDGADLQYMAALNKNSGQIVWKKDRTTDFKDLDKNGKPTRSGDLRKGYSTPLIIEAAGKVQLITPGAKAAFSLNPLTGDEYWTVTYDQHSAAARPLFVDGMLYLNTGYSKPVFMAVKVDGQGDVTKSHVGWKITKAIPKRSSPVMIDGLIYMIDDAGIATCHDAKTGKNVWTERVGDNHTSSPLYIDGRIYFFSEKGKVTVIAPGRAYKELAVNQLGDGFMSCPAATGNALILRSKSALYRVEKK